MDSEFASYKSKTDNAIQVLSLKIDKLGEIMNTNHQMMTDINRKFDMLYNEGTPLVDEKQAPKSARVPKKNILEAFREKYIADQTVWDGIIGKEVREKILDESKDKWENEDDKAIAQCAILYKSLNNSQKTKIQKSLKTSVENNQVELSKDVESSVFVKEEKKAKTKKPRAKKATKAAPDQAQSPAPEASAQAEVAETDKKEKKERKRAAKPKKSAVEETPNDEIEQSNAEEES